MYDFDEFLGRGIIAARTGRSDEAIKYLKIAEKIEPQNPRVWLWLATAATTLCEKRQCLERVLSLAPGTLVASALLERLNQQDAAIGQKPTDLVIFTCPVCGGKQHFDPDLLALVCEYCKHAEMLVLANAFNAEATLSPLLAQSSGNWAILNGQVTCSACGATLSLPADQNTHTCLFCGSDQVTVTAATPGLIPPTAILPFEIHSGDVSDILRKWWRIPIATYWSLLQVRDMTLSPVYLPFWTFDGRVRIRCKLERNVEPTIYSETERVVTIHDEHFLETGSQDWNWYECEIDDLLLYAARSVAAEAIAQISAFNLAALVEYRPAVLAGWQAEMYQVALEDAAVQAHKLMRDRAFSLAARRMLFMQPGDMLENDVLVMDKTYKLILLPVWIVRYTFRNQSCQVVINGQTGKVSGEQRLNWLIYALALLAAAILAALGLLLGRG